jgi:hypothetical protein
MTAAIVGNFVNANPYANVNQPRGRTGGYGGAAPPAGFLSASGTTQQAPRLQQQPPQQFMQHLQQLMPGGGAPANTHQALTLYTPGAAAAAQASAALHLFNAFQEYQNARGQNQQYP